VAVLGANLITFVNLAGLLWHYARFVRSRTDLVGVEKWITDYLSVYALWTAFVTFLFPFLFWFK
jgi:hypothetical protein